MDLHPESLAYLANQFGGLELGLRGQSLFQIPPNFEGEFVRLFGAALVREQSFQSPGLERLARLVDGGPGEAEIGRRLRNRLAVGLDGPEGLVFELEQIVRIVSTKRALLTFSGRGLRVPLERNAWILFRSGGILCKAIYTAYSNAVQGWQAKSSAIYSEQPVESGGFPSN